MLAGDSEALRGVRYRRRICSTSHQNGGDGGNPGNMFTTHHSKVNETEAKSRSPASSQKDVRDSHL